MYGPIATTNACLCSQWNVLLGNEITYGCVCHIKHKELLLVGSNISTQTKKKVQISGQYKAWYISKETPNNKFLVEYVAAQANPKVIQSIDASIIRIIVRIIIDTYNWKCKWKEHSLKV